MIFPPGELNPLAYWVGAEAAIGRRTDTAGVHMSGSLKGGLGCLMSPSCLESQGYR